jgi:wyosine [tRNA(Phe)-imidazoG37] synthetase (radical SAM superfamily)
VSTLQLRLLDWLRCTAEGEPVLHPHMVEMIEHAKAKGARGCG